jgi:hypothetical protein
LRTRPDACNIRIFTAGIAGDGTPFALAILEAPGVLFLIAFLLCFFSCPLVRCGPSVSRHRYSLPALTSTAAATTPAAAIASTTAAAAAFAGSLRSRFVYGYRAALEIRSIELRDRVRRFLIGRHLDKSEAFAAARVAIGDYRCGIYTARLSEQLSQTVIGSRKRKVSNVELIAHILLFSRLPNRFQNPQERT